VGLSAVLHLKRPARLRLILVGILLSRESICVLITTFDASLRPQLMPPLLRCVSSKQRWRSFQRRPGLLAALCSSVFRHADTDPGCAGTQVTYVASSLCGAFGSAFRFLVLQGGNPFVLGAGYARYAALRAWRLAALARLKFE
jgi:hypothetical protein